MNPIEDAVWRFMAGARRDTIQTGLNVASSLLPGGFQLEREHLGRSTVLGAVASLNPALRLPIEQMTNLDVRRDVPIVPRREEEVAGREQYGPTTSPAAVAAGRLTGISPRRIEYGAESFGGLSEQALSLLDLAFPGTRAELPLVGDEALARMPGLGFLLRRFVGSTRDEIERDRENRFFQHYAEAREVVRTYNYLARQGRGGMQRAETYLRADPRRRLLYDVHGELQTLANDLAAIRAQQRVILGDESVSGEEKLRQIRSLREAYRSGLRSVEVLESLLGGGSAQAAMPPPARVPIGR